MKWPWVRCHGPNRVRVPDEVLTRGQAALRRITIVYEEPGKRRRARIEAILGLVVGGAFWLVVWIVYVEGFGGWLRRHVGPSAAILLLLFVVPALALPLTVVALEIARAWLRRPARSVRSMPGRPPLTPRCAGFRRSAMPLGRFAQIAHDHLKEHRPKMYRELKASGQLEEFLKERAEAAGSLLSDLIGQGAAHDAAWEEASRELYLPTEEDVPHLGESPQPYQ